MKSASRAADSATNLREAADFETPDPAGAGTSPSGSRTARPNRRVDTLISIRFIAQRYRPQGVVFSTFDSRSLVQVGKPNQIAATAFNHNRRVPASSF